MTGINCNTLLYILHYTHYTCQSVALRLRLLQEWDHINACHAGRPPRREVRGGDPGGAATAADEIPLEEVPEGEHAAGGGWPHRRCPRLRHLVLHPRGGGETRGARPQAV